MDTFGEGCYSIHHSWDDFHVLLFIAGMKKISYIYLFALTRMVCEILVSWPGIKLLPPAVEAES